MKKFAEIFVVTHGKYKEDLVDPPLNEEGRSQARKLATKLGDFDVVVLGEGIRHRETYEIIKISPETLIVSDLAGRKEVMASDGKTIIFPNGKRIPFIEVTNQFEEIKHKIPDFLRKIALDYLGKKILIVGGRIVVIGAGLDRKKVKSACIYRINFTPSGEIIIKEE